MSGRWHAKPVVHQSSVRGKEECKSENDNKPLLPSEASSAATTTKDHDDEEEEEEQEEKDFCPQR